MRLGSQALSNTESAVPAFRHGVFHIEVLDARPTRPVSQLALESIDGLDLAFGRRFDAAVGQIAHPAVQTFTPGGSLHEKPEPDALHAAADQEASRDAHLTAQKTTCPPAQPSTVRPSTDRASAAEAAD